MGLAKIYPYTKFEVSGFTRFRFTEEGLQFKIIGPCLDLTMPLLGVRATIALSAIVARSPYFKDQALV